MKVLAVTNMYPTPDDPAFGVFVATQMASLADAGVQVEVAFLDGRRAGVLAYMRWMPGLRRIASTGRFDLVHAHYGLTGAVAAFQSLPLVISFCGDDLLGTPDGRGGITPKSRISRHLSRWAAGRADGIICKSDELRRALPLQLQAEAAVIPNGVDTDRFRPGDRRAARERLGLRESDKVIFFPHTPGEARKRIDLARAGVEALVNMGRPARLWTPARVPQVEMPDYYRAADCLLLTSDWEGSPNVVKEALCCDLPVVSVAVGDVARWAAMTDGCCLVERNPAAIANGLRRAIDLEAADGTRVREALALRETAARLLEVYESALTRAASGMRI